MSTVRRISKNIAALSFAEVFSKILQFVIMIYAARLLDKESFGIFSFALAFSFIAVIFANLGVTTFIIRVIARDKNKAAKYYGNAFLLKIFLAAATFLLVFVLLEFLEYDGRSKTVVYLICTFAVISSFTDLSYSIFRSFERMGYDALIKVLRMIILVALAFFTLSNNYGVIFFSLSFVITELIVLLVSLLIVFTKFIKPPFGFDMKFTKNLLAESIPFGMAFAFGSVYFYIDERPYRCG